MKQISVILWRGLKYRKNKTEWWSDYFSLLCTEICLHWIIHIWCSRNLFISLKACTACKQAHYIRNSWHLETERKSMHLGNSLHYKAQVIYFISSLLAQDPLKHFVNLPWVQNLQLTLFQVTGYFLCKA